MTGRQSHAIPQGRDEHRSPWQLLHIFNLYRIILSGLFLVLSLSGADLPVIGSYNPFLFKLGSFLYLVVSVIGSFFIQHRWFSFRHQAVLQIIIDTFFLLLLSFASGGVRSGLGMLLVVSVAGTSIVLEGRLAFLFASTTSLAVILEEIYLHLYTGLPGSYTHAGLLGASMFATVMLVSYLARRIRLSEELVKARDIDLRNLAELNDYIIQHMLTGILVIDSDERLRLVNSSARELLQIGQESLAGRRLGEISDKLYKQYRQWKSSDTEPRQIFRASEQGSSIQAGFAVLGSGTGALGTLIFLEDASAMSQRAQQIKLAALGRLTASIAHEVRNPLGAISHASQLLSENAATGESDVTARLTEIIDDNTRRVNRIVERILGISRQEDTKPEVFHLADWLQSFVQEFTRTQQASAEDIKVDVTDADITVRMDPLQLQQVLWNLCTNALRYSRTGTPQGGIILRAGIGPDQQRPYLDVIDHGPGVDPAQVNEIFEPFYTTERSGTGLGLYIARELCEGNQAYLDYLPAPGGGSCFRITFAVPGKRQVA